MDLEYYIKEAIHAAEYSFTTGVIHAVSSMTHSSFVGKKIIFNLSDVFLSEMVRDIIQRVVDTRTSLTVSYIM